MQGKFVTLGHCVIVLHMSIVCFVCCFSCLLEFLVRISGVLKHVTKQRPKVGERQKAGTRCTGRASTDRDTEKYEQSDREEATAPVSLEQRELPLFVESHVHR